MPSITQENIENVTFGRMAALLKYVGTGPVNDLVKGELLALLEDFEGQQTEIELFTALVSRLEAKNWQAGQIKKVVDMLAEARQKKRKDLREKVTVSHTPAFISGLIDASRVIESGPGRLIQSWVFSNGVADADLQLFDSPDLLNCQNNDLLLRVRCPGVALSNSESLKEEIPFISGLTAVLQGAGSSYCIEYKILEKGRGG